MSVCLLICVSCTDDIYEEICSNVFCLVVDGVQASHRASGHVAAETLQGPGSYVPITGINRRAAV